MPSILIVDDNLINLKILSSFLKKEELTFETANDGIIALDLLSKKKFDLILLDIMMPGMDGYEVCSILKKDKALSEIPIIFLTGLTDSESIIKGFELGAVDYITKPFIKSELLIRVTTQLKIKENNELLIYYLHQIQERNREIFNSIDYARYIQNAVLNTSEKNLEFLPEHFFLDIPKDVLSGDFYSCYFTDKKIIVAVLDSSGHGVPGALLSILGITLLNEIIINNHITQPDKILDLLRKKIITTLAQKKETNSIKDAIEGSVICFDSGSQKLLYSGAYNPMILIRDGKIINIKADRMPIGYYEVDGDFTLHEVEIKRDDTVYLFSDGIIDQFGGPENKRFMIKHLKEILMNNQNKPMIRQKEILLKELNQWKGELIQTDDILVFGVRF
jgi:phosphoserine phosphatase RsbU/P